MAFDKYISEYNLTLTHCHIFPHRDIRTSHRAVALMSLRIWHVQVQFFWVAPSGAIVSEMSVQAQFPFLNGSYFFL